MTGSASEFIPPFYRVSLGPPSFCLRRVSEAKARPIAIRLRRRSLEGVKGEEPPPPRSSARAARLRSGGQARKSACERDLRRSRRRCGLKKRQAPCAQPA